MVLPTIVICCLAALASTAQGRGGGEAPAAGATSHSHRPSDGVWPYYIVEGAGNLAGGLVDGPGTVVLASAGTGHATANTFTEHNAILAALGQPEAVVVLISLIP